MFKRGPVVEQPVHACRSARPGRWLAVVADGLLELPHSSLRPAQNIIDHLVGFHGITLPDALPTRHLLSRNAACSATHGPTGIFRISAISDISNPGDKPDQRLSE
jgi:hypothetical protein